MNSCTVLLAWDVNVRTGHVEVTVPYVFTGDDYSLVCQFRLELSYIRYVLTLSSIVFGDSGDISETFTIVGPL